MSRILIYLSRSFLTVWLSVVLGFLVLIGLLDSLANAGDLLDDGDFIDTFIYIVYRAPVIFDRIFIFTIVISVLLVFVRLIRNHELVALLGFGFSVPKQITFLAPIVFICSVVSLIVINIAMPPAVRALQAWGVGDYEVKAISVETPLWITDNDDIVLAQGRPGMNELSDLVIFERDKDGNIQREIYADWASYDGNGNWVLKKDVRVLDVAGADGERRTAKPAQDLRWQTRHTPGTIARLAAEPRDLSLGDMKNFSQPGNSGSRPQSAYEFWYWHRLTRPFVAILLLLCAVPIMQRTGRQDNGDKALLTGLAFGFIFLIIDGAMATFATSGGISIFMGITIPLGTLFIVGGWLTLRTETLSLRRS